MIIDASELLDTRIISVVGCDYIEEYATVLQNCQKLGELDPNPYQAKNEGEVCLVSHESEWCRGLYDITDGKFMLLDVGIIANVPMANVRRFPAGLSKIVYNNEVIVESKYRLIVSRARTVTNFCALFFSDLPVLKSMITNGKPDSIHGKVIEAWVANSEDGVCVRIVP